MTNPIGHPEKSLILEDNIMRPRFRCLTIAFSISFLGMTVQTQAEERPRLKKLKPPSVTLLGHPLIFRDEFNNGKADHWEPTDPTAWRVIRQGRNYVYNQFKKRSKYKPPVRSPYNRSLVKGIHVGSFVLDVHVQSTHKDYGHRDLCLFFGYQDNAHLYYVHLGKKTDDHANQIFIVNGKPRTKISTKTTPGTNWDDEWHHVRIVRDVNSGKIEVYFDDMSNPVMKANDKTFTWGRVGVGSFDDTGNFDRVLLYGEKVSVAKKK
ncbi:MAG: hypothetical protein Tsb009_39270 [Planctomycetaceae bacterium]